MTDGTQDQKPKGMSDGDWKRLLGTLHLAQRGETEGERESARLRAAEIIINHGLLDEIAANPDLLNHIADAARVSELELTTAELFDANEELAARCDALTNENQKLRKEPLTDKFRRHAAKAVTAVTSKVPGKLASALELALAAVGGPIYAAAYIYLNKDNDPDLRKPKVIRTVFLTTGMISALFWALNAAYEMDKSRDYGEAVLDNVLKTAPVCAYKGPPPAPGQTLRQSCPSLEAPIGPPTSIFGFQDGPYFVQKTVSSSATEFLAESGESRKKVCVSELAYICNERFNTLDQSIKDGPADPNEPRCKGDVRVIRSECNVTP